MGVLGLPSGFSGGADAGRAGPRAGCRCLPRPDADARRDSIDRPGRNLLDGHPQPQARKPRAIGPDLRPLRNRAIGSGAIHARPSRAARDRRRGCRGKSLARTAEEVWPGEWDDAAKDQLERQLAILVCGGQLDARAAQQAIAEDWTEHIDASSTIPGRCNGDKIKTHPYATSCPSSRAKPSIRSPPTSERQPAGADHDTRGLILDGATDRCYRRPGPKHFLEFEGDDPLAFVLSLNLHRRHLTPSQCAMVGADLATMRQGARTDIGQPSASLPEVSQTQARLSTASERGIRSAVFVKKKGSHDLVQAVRDGKIAVSLAARLATASEAI